NRVLSTADPDDVWILLVDGNRADRSAEILVADRNRGLPTVGRFPHTAARRAKVVLVRTRHRTRHGDHAAGRLRADVPPRDITTVARIGGSAGATAAALRVNR